MTPINPTSPEHRDAWDILPWYVTARITERDRARVESHLQTCAACRDELLQQRQLHGAMAVESAIEHMPTLSLQRLQRRLDGAAPPDSPSAVAIPAAPRFTVPHRLLVASVAVMAVALSVVAATMWTQSQHRAQPADYYTVTTATLQVPAAAIRAVFSPAITLSELQTVLDEAQLKIVAGPSEAGVYSLATTTARPVIWSLQKLRGHASVRFAEATGAAPASGRAPPAAGHTQ